MKNLFQNEKGVSLLEVVVAMAILSIMSVSIMKLLDVQLQSSNRISVDLEIMSMGMEIQTLLANDKACLNTVAQSPTNSQLMLRGEKVDLSELRDQLGNTVFEVNKSDSNRYEISKMELVIDQSVSPLPYNGESYRPGGYQFNIFVRFTKFGHHGAPKGEKVVKAQLKGNFNAAGNMDNCISYETQAIETGIAQAVQDSGREICRANHGTWHPDDFYGTNYCTYGSMLDDSVDPPIQMRLNDVILALEEKINNMSDCMELIGKNGVASAIFKDYNGKKGCEIVYDSDTALRFQRFVEVGRLSTDAEKEQLRLSIDYSPSEVCPAGYTYGGKVKFKSGGGFKFHCSGTISRTTECYTGLNTPYQDQPLTVGTIRRDDSYECTFLSGREFKSQACRSAVEKVFCAKNQPLVTSF